LTPPAPSGDLGRARVRRLDGVQIELQQVDDVDPPELAELIARRGVLTHASYRVPDLVAETGRLSRIGVEPFLEN
jgi:hypothetical protein